MSLSADTKKQIKYDKLNTKYNRLYNQLTSICLFVLATIVAYSISYIEYSKSNNPHITIFLTKIIIPLLILIISISIVYGVMTTLIITTGIKLHKFLKKEGIKIN